MSAKIYIEGGGDSAELQTRCREAFRRLLLKCGFQGRMPRLVACGGREATFADFTTAHKRSPTGAYVALLVDSEDSVKDIEKPWAHLSNRDQWEPPAGATDEQVFLMTTCMESWIAADRAALQRHYGEALKVSLLPPLNNIESQPRQEVQNALCKATASCKNGYAKGRRSFEIVCELTPGELGKYLPSFKRVERVLTEKL